MGWFVRVLFAAVLLVVYVTISAEGVRTLFEIAATPLHKTGLWPMTYLAGFDETRKLDIAHVLCLTLMVVVWVSWEMIVCVAAGGATPTPALRIVCGGGVVVLACDAALFWIGISQSGLFGGSTAAAASLLTALYTAMLVLVATWVNMAEGRIR